EYQSVSAFDPATDDARARHHAGSLQRRSGADVVLPRASAGDVSPLVADPLQLLDQIAGEPATPVRLGDLHENVAVWRVVVVQQAAGRHDAPVHLDAPLAYGLDAVLEGDVPIRFLQLAKDRARRKRQMRPQAIVEKDRVARQVSGP